MKNQSSIRQNIGNSAWSRQFSLTKVLLSCGVLSSVLYVISVSIGANTWPGYNPVSQSVSELFAIGAPSTPYMLPWLVLYALLIFLFGAGIIRSAGTSRFLRIMAILIIFKEVLGLVATIVFPMHLRGIEGTMTDTMHAALTGVGVLLCMFPAIGFGAASFGRQFRLYSIVTMAIFIICGVLAGMQGPNVAANLPTPYLGVLERINIYTYMTWIVVLGITLLRKKPESNYV